MTVVAVVGAQWGDEGKGKIVDILAAEAEVVVRFQGGNNAGHTLVVDGEKTIFHLVPSGILHPGKVCVLGQGMVINPTVLLEELDKLDKLGRLSNAILAISNRAHVILPHHMILDRLREEKKSSSVPVGTTLRGIGPTYEDKVGRRGVRIGDLIHRERFAELLGEALTYHRPIMEAHGAEVPDKDEVVKEYSAMGERLKSYITDVPALLHQNLDEGKRILLEGAQGALLDIDHGTYPYVTSSNTTAGAACAGAGIGPGAINKVVAVVKAYTTRVGGGPFPTEETGKAGKHMQDVGVEYGSTTGRPRRCGWLDAASLRRTTRLSGATGMAITKLDVLSGLDTINVCTGYMLDGKEVDAFGLANIDRLKPIYRTFEGWKEDITAALSMDDLPKAARNYLQGISEIIGCPIDIVSIGPGREQTILINTQF
ncbi:MAG: adenylosuccinate synthase [Proteobacteria bacterium]|nr:adenylosuccinate synthase [Pseudomonadota bacterium]